MNKMFIRRYFLPEKVLELFQTEFGIASGYLKAEMLLINIIFPILFA